MIPSEMYRRAIMLEMIILKDAYGIHHGDTLHLSSAGDDFFVPSGREFFAYADRILSGGGIEEGHVLITLCDVGPHEPRPWYSKQCLENAKKRGPHGDA